MTESQSSLEITRSDNIAVLRLNRPRKRNALNEPTIRALERFFSDVPDGIRAAVIHGAGEHFSAGLDLSELTTASTAFDAIKYSMVWYRAFNQIQFGTVPVVAVVQGAVIGGGLELACAAHIRVAESSAFYSLPEGQRGIFVGGGASVRLPRIIGVSRMADMMLTGRIFDAQEGQQIGLSQYLVPEGAGLSKGLELARKMAANAPLTNFAVMQALPRIADASQETGFLTEALMSAITKDAPDAKERVREFLEKKTGGKAEKP
jgi:enoyl-CoA hydratase/carnithine racemase